MIKGLGVSAGIAMGEAYVIPSWEWELPDEMADVNDLAFEFERLYEGIRSSKNELELIKQKIKEALGKDEAFIFDAHLAILEDPAFMNEIQTIIARQSKAAEVAVKEVIDKFVDSFSELDDEYMKERAMDIKDVGNRLLKHLLGDYEEKNHVPEEPYILVAKELTPSQLTNLDPDKVLGIVTMLGGATSHSAILSRALSIPFVMGLEGKLLRPIQQGDFLIIDGEQGELYIDPDESIKQQYRERKARFLAYQEKLQEIAHVSSVTRDGLYVKLEANINAVNEIDQAIQNGAYGVGLFRTEFLYMDRQSLPTEEEQFEVYKEAAGKLGEKPLVIRTLDIGGDKQLSYLPLAVEDNPFLGYRAIRVSLDRKELFKTQLRAILRAGNYGKIKLMYPMISSIDEVLKANALLEEAKEELRKRSLDFCTDLEVGVTIEVPGAALIADLLVQEVDFLSIGTNDLTQYILAVDRMNEHVAHLYDPFHPAVIRLLKYTVDTAKAAGIPIAVCGELAGDIRYLPLWIGMGIDEMSISVRNMLNVKNHLLSSNYQECKELLAKVLKLRTSSEIQEVLR